MKVGFQLRLVFLGRLTPQLEDSANVARIQTVCGRSKDDDFERAPDRTMPIEDLCASWVCVGAAWICKIVCKFPCGCRHCRSKEKVALRTKLCYTFATNHNPHEIAHTQTHTHWQVIAVATVSDFGRTAAELLCIASRIIYADRISCCPFWGSFCRRTVWATC